MTRMIDEKSRSRLIEAHKNLASMIDLTQLNINDFATALGFDIEGMESDEFLKHVKTLMQMTYRDLAAWCNLKARSLDRFLYGKGGAKKAEIKFPMRVFLLYQMREYVRFQDIEATAIPDEYRSENKHELR